MRSAPTAMIRAGTAGALLAGFLLAAVPVPALWAGEARLVEAQGSARVVVEASDASVDEVLAVLAARFQFDVERSAPAMQPLRLSGRYAGTLEEVLDRLLRHQGHMIVRSAAAPAGIGRVVLIEARAANPAAAGAPAAELPSPIAALKARLQLQERKEPPK